MTQEKVEEFIDEPYSSPLMDSVPLIEYCEECLGNNLRKFGKLWRCNTCDFKNIN